MDKGVKNYFYREDWYLFAIFILMAAAVILKSYFDPDGRLSPDSTYYLRLAQNLIEGKGYYISIAGSDGPKREFFAIWPAGYPTLIYIIAKITGFSVFWASKSLNLAFVGFILLVFRGLFKNYAYVYGLILLFSGNIEIFSYTWSETFFIAGLVWLSISVYSFLQGEKPKILSCFSLMFASLSLFAARYIGAFSLGLIGLLFIYFTVIKKDGFRSFILTGILLVNTCLMCLYLYHNFIETGYITGTERILSIESNSQLLWELFTALLAETLIPIFYFPKSNFRPFAFFSIIQAALIAYFLLKNHRDKSITDDIVIQKSLIPSFVFGLVGLTYYLSIISIRWIRMFDSFSFRLLGPGTFLFFIAAIFLFQAKQNRRSFNSLKALIIVLSIISYAYVVPYRIWRSWDLNENYYKHIEFIKDKFCSIDKSGIVIFGSRHLNYLYTDMIIMEPESMDFQQKENWSSFLNKVERHNDHIYLFVSKKELKFKSFDKSVIDYVDKFEDGALVELK